MTILLLDFSVYLTRIEHNKPAWLAIFKSYTATQSMALLANIAQKCKSEVLDSRTRKCLPGRRADAEIRDFATRLNERYETNIEQPQTETGKHQTTMALIDGEALLCAKLTRSKRTKWIRRIARVQEAMRSLDRYAMQNQHGNSD